MYFWDQSVVLTGACGGLGQALARELLSQGATVALLGLRREALEPLLAFAPGRAFAYTLDVTDSAAMGAIARDWMARHGVPGMVIANAGVAGGFDPAQAGDLDVLRRMLEINVLGVATTFQPFVQPLRAQGRGALVGVASIAGWRGMPGNGAYCASKGATIRYLESLRAELRGSGVGVHTVSPGYLRTAMTAGNHFAMPCLMEPADAARGLLEGVERGREHIVLPRPIGWLSRALSLLPTGLHDRVLLRQPRKVRPGEPGASPIPGLATPFGPEPQPPLP